MEKKEKKSQYTVKMRLTKRHRDWIKKNKTTRTDAGYLALIVEHWITRLKLNKIEAKEKKAEAPLTL